MSASTVSITANPAAARRRPVEKKHALDLVSGDGMVAASPISNGGEKVTGGDVGKDLSHSIRGEAVLDRSREVPVVVKKTLPSNASGLPRRTTRKGVPKPEKSKWATVTSVFTKNFLLLMILLGLVQLIRKTVTNSGGTNTPANLDFEGRLAEVEGFVKTSTKMMQVQVEVVDRKIEAQIGGLRREFDGKIKDKDLKFAAELKKLDGRTESLEKFLGELDTSGWLKKDDFERFFEEFRKAKGIDSTGSVGADDLNLDEVRAFAREIIDKEMDKHAADGLGRVDYALASGGGMVVKHSEPYGVGKGGSWLYMSNRNGVHANAEKMLRPSFGEPGQCFPLKGSSGFVQIKLRTAIIPEAITLEHVAKSVAYDRSSAPKYCRVSGWLQGNDPTSNLAVDNQYMHLLTEFTYDLDKSNAQTYDVLDSAFSGTVDMIRLDFTSNHGNPSHTCIYRLRVHGRQPNSIWMLPTQP